MSAPKPVRVKPARAWPVGSFIRDELDARGWTVGDLVARMEPIQALEDRAVNALSVNLLLHVSDPKLRMGKLAEPMAKALGVSVEFLMNLERAYVDWCASAAQGKGEA